jgi:1,4-dihydroxy-2-naphthoate octaprenyltransferase
LVNNIRDEAMDRKAGFTTLPMRVGPAISRRLYALLISASIVIPPLLYLTAHMGGWILLPLLSLPLAIRLIHRVFKAKQPPLDLKNGPPQTAGFYMLFGILTAIGLAFCG